MALRDESSSLGSPGFGGSNAAAATDQFPSAPEADSPLSLFPSAPLEYCGWWTQQPIQPTGLLLSAPEAGPPSKSKTNDSTCSRRSSGEDRERNRERNREAARRCRAKKKAREVELEAKVREAKAQNQALQTRVGQLREELYQLKNELLQHAGCNWPRIREYLRRAADVASAEPNNGLTYTEYNTIGHGGNPSYAFDWGDQG